MFLLIAVGMVLPATEAEVVPEPGHYRLQNRMTSTASGCTGDTVNHYHALPTDYAHRIVVTIDANCRASTTWEWTTPLTLTSLDAGTAGTVITDGLGNGNEGGVIGYFSGLCSSHADGWATPTAGYEATAFTSTENCQAGGSQDYRDLLNPGNGYYARQSIDSFGVLACEAERYAGSAKYGAAHLCWYAPPSFSYGGATWAPSSQQIPTADPGQTIDVLIQPPV